MAYLDRMRGRIDRRHVCRATISVLGPGSVGGPIAWRLAQLVPRGLILVDGDDYEEENRFRHPLPREYVGMNKAVALADMIDLEIDGIKSIVAIPHHVEPGITDDLVRCDVIEPATVVIVATDNIAVNRQVALVARQRGVPALVPAIAADGSRGEVFLSLTEDLPCPVCFDGFRHAGDPVRGAAMLATDLYPVVQLTVALCLGLLNPRSRDGQLLEPFRPGGPPPQLFRAWPPGGRELQVPDDGRTEVRWRRGCPGCGGGPQQTDRPSSGSRVNGHLLAWLLGISIVLHGCHM
jgi:ThiF family